MSDGRAFVIALRRARARLRAQLRVLVLLLGTAQLSRLDNRGVGEPRKSSWLLGTVVFVVVVVILGGAGIALQQGADGASSVGVGLASGLIAFVAIAFILLGMLIGHRVHRGRKVL